MPLDTRLRCYVLPAGLPLSAVNSGSNTASPNYRGDGGTSWHRPLSACLVVIAHVLAATWFLRDQLAVPRLRRAADPMIAELIGEEIGIAPNTASTLPSSDPRIELSVPDLPMDSMPEPNIESPQIQPEQSARLTGGVTATVILELLIGADGSVMSAHVVRSSGDEAATAAAIDYARATRWIPGSVDGEPRPMQASLTVIMGESV